MKYVNLVVDHKSKHTDDLYTYRVEDSLSVGQVVQVRFGKGNRPKRGYIVEEDVVPTFDASKIKPVDGLDPDISLNEEMIQTALWMRSRYGIKYLDGIRCFVPTGKPPKPGKEKLPYRDVQGEEQVPDRQLTEEQNRVCSAICEAVDYGKQKNFLIHGVTGSGKTEVYMQAIAHVLAQGKSAIMLVPEIALTKQILERFIGRFGREDIAVMHSKLTPRERYDEWVRLRNGEAHIAIGARTAIFAPLENIGLIILDEEHEATYKADQSPKFDTVDIAVKRLMYSNGVMVLGSATPSVVSYQRAQEGIYEILEMQNRYNAVPLPKVELVDMREELRVGNRGIFSRKLLRDMEHQLAQGSQVILFLNRRGYSTAIVCEDCGASVKCPECGITLVYHKREHAGVCHYCGKRYPLPEACPECNGESLRYVGTGTEKIEEITQSLFPDKVVERFDLDTAKNTREINRIINDFAKGKTHILIGTQLVAKGLDFKNVGLVGVISADVSLNIPDYRSTERTFQLVTQVAGRAGRGDTQGHVIVQSMTPENFALTTAAKHDYHGFFAQEIRIRQFMDYPPYSDLIAVEFTTQDENLAMEQAGLCRDFLIRCKLPMAEKIFAPRKNDSFKGQDAVRYQILIKAPKGARNPYIHYIHQYSLTLMKQRIDCNVTIDVNPYSTV